MASEYHEIRKRFNVIKNYPPAHRSEFRHEAMEFFKAKFGVVHLEDLVGNITFFEHLASISGKHIQGPNTTFLDSSPSDLPKTLQESRGKELVVELVGAMRGVTHCRGDTWLSVVTKLVSTMKKLTNTLALEFLEDICNTFPEKGQSLDSFIKERKSNYNVADSIRPLVKQVEDLHDKYYRIKDSSEQLAVEEDIVGKILETFRCGISLEIQHVLVKVVHEILHYKTTDGSMDLPEKKVRFECLTIAGEFFRAACSEVPHDNVAHLRRLMANAREGVSMYELYHGAREERRDGGIGDPWSKFTQNTTHPRDISG